MLRLGHLKVLCEACSHARTSWKSITNEAATTLTKLVPVGPVTNEVVSQYLYQKKLCPIANTPSQKEIDAYRYPNLIVNASGTSLESADGKPHAIWWQDMCLAAPDVRS